jgi:excinuclease UvrABC ATPase subunit
LSLVVGTIAAESQRLINETRSAFVQGFMPALARPEVDVLEGLTTAIIVDQERMGANARSTVGTATDANARDRVVFGTVTDALLLATIMASAIPAVRGAWIRTLH